MGNCQTVLQSGCIILLFTSLLKYSEFYSACLLSLPSLQLLPEFAPFILSLSSSYLCWIGCLPYSLCFGSFFCFGIILSFSRCFWGGVHSRWIFELLIVPLHLNCLAGYRILGWKSWSFRILSLLLCCLLGSRRAVWNSEPFSVLSIIRELYSSGNLQDLLCVPPILKFHIAVGTFNLETHVLQHWEIFLNYFSDIFSYTFLLFYFGSACYLDVGLPGLISNLKCLLLWFSVSLCFYFLFISIFYYLFRCYRCLI